MQVVRSWLSRVPRLLLLILLLALLLAIGWTASQILSIAGGLQPLIATSDARKAAYSATATAIESENGHASLRIESRIVFVQQEVDADTPQPAPAAATQISTEAAATAVPDDFDLPQLLVPLDPDEGAWLSGTRVPRRVPEIHRAHRLINIMLLGSDEELTEDNFVRTDTMIVVSLNTETGTVSMLSLPRDLFVYMPHGRMGRLNTAFGIGEYRGWEPAGGFGLLRQTIFYNFGINVHYYARVNFSGFQAIIDQLGGVDIAVDCAYRDYYPVGQPGAGESATFRWRTLPVGYYTFNGFDALWYARTRKYTDDFDRGRRQQQLLRAMWRKIRDQGLLTTLPSLWPQLVEIVDTDIPFDLVLRLLPHILNLDLSNIENYTFSKNYHTSSWRSPDGSSVQLPNPAPVALLMTDFYRPPSPNQVALTGPSIAVYNASGAENWDIVASERLRWGGYHAIALGPAPDSTVRATNLLTDYIATEKGSLIPGIIKALNMSTDQVQRDPKADRAYDYEVIIGRDYQSCTFGVLPLDG